jgi:ferredoxin
MLKWRKIIVCVCAERRLLPDDNIRQFVAAAQKSKIPLIIVSDCCYMTAKNPEQLQALTFGEEPVLFAGCKPRAIEALFTAANANIPDFVLSLRDKFSPEQLAASGLALTDEFADISFPEIDAGWPAWYPVIDRKRCANCRKCADFCLFGVYSIQDGQVCVVNPANCKNNCPACARICPFQAIIFPKSDLVPINGAKVEPEHIMKIRTESGNLRQLLEVRKQQKRKLFRD